MMNQSTTRSRIDRTLAAVALLLVTFVASATATPRHDDRDATARDCENVQPPAGSHLVFHAYAEGVQIYRWNGSSWSLFAPAAVLYADADGNASVGIHYAGPTWESTSGSKVVGTVAQRCDRPGTIQWLLLDAAFTSGPGVFEKVTHIQRVNTTGGRAPSYPGSTTGETVNVEYTAEYFFYRLQ